VSVYRLPEKLHVATRLQCSCASRIEPRQVRPRTDPVQASHSTLARRRRPDPVQVVRPSVQVSAQHGSRISGRALQTCLYNIDGHRHLRSAGRGQLDVPRVRLSTYGERAFCYVEPSAWNAVLFLTFSKQHFLCLLLDASSNISTSRSTNTPSAFEVILQLTRYTNYLLTYLLTYRGPVYQLHIIRYIWHDKDVRVRYTSYMLMM